LYESGGIFNQNMLLVNFNSRPARGIAIFGNYSLMSINSDVDNSGSPSDPYDFKLDYGRSVLERRSRFQLVGSLPAPMGFRLNPFVIVQSGAPYNMVIGEDLNGDTLQLQRPAFATDLTRSSVRVTQFGAFDIDPEAGQTIVPRDYLTGAGLVSLNLRLARTFGFGSRTGGGGGGRPAGSRIGDGSLLGALDGGGDSRMTLTLSVIAANIINHTNPTGYVGSLLSPLFAQPTLLNGGFGGGILTSPANNRRLEFQSRLAF
jgi:hypothetical protein